MVSFFNTRTPRGRNCIYEMHCRYAYFSSPHCFAKLNLFNRELRFRLTANIFIIYSRKSSMGLNLLIALEYIKSFVKNLFHIILNKRYSTSIIFLIFWLVYSLVFIRGYFVNILNYRVDIK